MAVANGYSSGILSINVLKRKETKMDFGRVREIQEEAAAAIYNHDYKKIVELLGEVRNLCRTHCHPNHGIGLFDGEMGARFDGKLVSLFNILAYLYCEDLGKKKCPKLDGVCQYIFGYGSSEPNPCPSPIDCDLRDNVKAEKQKE